VHGKDKETAAGLKAPALHLNRNASATACGSKVLGEMGNPLLVLSGDKSACESRGFYRKEKSRHHLTGGNGANSIKVCR
jgi:hypothetical protein